MSPAPVAVTESGAVRGEDAGDILQFLGIPYAHAERFAAPGPAEPWAGERDATAPGPAAPQPERAVAQFTHGPRPVTAEDCLNLNIWTPGLTGNRPVLVWVHGGGFAIGHGLASIYHGADLARAGDLVVVTLNYRLGSLGWLGHPDLATGPGAPAANWGLLDQEAALRWVRENVAAFGGDPAQVTLAGQSAGALSAMDLLVSPTGGGLFARVILQSPPIGDVAQPPERAEGWAQALAQALGTADVRGLRSIGADAIVEGHERLLATEVYAGTRGGALPTIDPATIPVSPVQRPDGSPEVDVLIGDNADEGSFFFGSPWRPAPPPQRIPSIVGHLTGQDPQAVLERYRDAAQAGRSTETVALLRRIATDALIAAPAAAWASARAAAGPRVYRYRVDHPGAGVDLGATHTCEVPLLFGTVRDGGPGERLGGQPVPDPCAAVEDVATALRGAWIGFIHGDGPGWAPVATGEAEDLGVFGGRAPLRVERAVLA